MLTSTLVPAASIRRPRRTCTRAAASGCRPCRCGGCAVCNPSCTIIIVIVVVIVIILSKGKSGARHSQRRCRSKSEAGDRRRVLRLRGQRPRHFLSDGGGGRVSHGRYRSRCECRVSHMCGRRIESYRSIRSIGVARTRGASGRTSLANTRGKRGKKSSLPCKNDDRTLSQDPQSGEAPEVFIKQKSISRAPWPACQPTMYPTVNPSADDRILTAFARGRKA